MKLQLAETGLKQIKLRQVTQMRQGQAQRLHQDILTR